ncbi:MAG: anion permease [Anaerolineae bacterium]|nr:anion permease [Anaerolineae bacterium]
MNSEILIVLALTGVAIVLMMAELLRADLVAWLLAIGLVLSGVIAPEEAFSGFSQSAVITILAIFILTAGLDRTGVIRHVGLVLRRVAGNHPTRFLTFVMVSGAALSFFMNNIAAAAVLLPAVIDVARQTKTSPSKLLMPLAFAVNLGGLATLLATSNILVSATLRDLGFAPYTMLDFVPVGLPLIVVGILYVLVIGRRLLPSVDLVEQFGRTHRLWQELAKTYALEERLNEVFILDKSPLVGQSIAGSQIGKRLGLSILAVSRHGEPAHVAPGPDYAIRAGDTFLVTGRPERVQQLVDFGAEVFEAVRWNDSLSTEQITLSEVTLAPRSRAVGQTLKDLRFREKYGLSVVAIWRGGRPYRTDVGDMPLQFGDAFLVHGPRQRISLLRADPDFILLTELRIPSESEVPERARRGWLAALIMALTLAAAASGLLPIAVAMMLGALVMVAVGCLTVDEAYRGVEWRAVFLIAGMLPVGIALTESGAAAWLGEWLVTTLVDWGPLALAGGVFLLAALLAQVMSGQVTAVVLTPVAVAAAQYIGVDPRAMAMAVALGCGMVFMTPMSHPVNVFVMGPGGYRFRDFVRMGLPLTALLFLTVLILLPIFWPLG